MEDYKDHIAPFYLDDSHLSVGTKEYLKIINAFDTPLEYLPVKEARRVLKEAQETIEVDLSGIHESVKVIQQDQFEIKLTIVRPENSNQTILPAFIFIHGGGWSLGDYTTHKRLVRDLVVESGVACVFPNYSLSPESGFPQAINEVYATLKWLSRNGEDIYINGNNLALTGNDTGGNMAIVICMMAKDNNGPEIKLQVLLWPVTDTGMHYDSFMCYGEDRFLTTSMMELTFDQYIQTGGIRKDIHISPVLASTDQLKGLPPTLVITAENDITRDEGEALGRKLDEAGVEVTSIRFNGVIHEWGMLNGFAKLPPTKELVTFTAAALKKHLF